MFPENGLPDRVDVIRYVEAGLDDDDNPVYTPTTVIEQRKARFYRDIAKTSRFVKDGFRVTGVVAFKYHSGDTVLGEDEIKMNGPEFQDSGDTFQVGWATLKMAWKKPSHWEVGLGVYI